MHIKAQMLGETRKNVDEAQKKGDAAQFAISTERLNCLCLIIKIQFKPETGVGYDKYRPGDCKMPLNVDQHWTNIERVLSRHHL